MAGLLSTLTRWEAIEEIDIYGGRSALDRVHDLLFEVVFRGIRPPIELNLLEVNPGLIFDTEDFSVTAFPVSHRGPDCYGYQFEEKARRPFLPEKAEALEIPPGPWRRDMVAGKTVTLPDGREITPDQVLGTERPGTKFVHVGDTGRTDNLAQYVQDADTLVIESTYMEEEAEMGRKFAHLTASQASQFAQEVNVKHLILTHISRRYRERDILAEARSIFPNTYVARDFDTFQIRRDECQKIEN